MNIRYQMNGTGKGGRANGHGPAPVIDREARRPLFHSDCVWLDGELAPSEEATVHLLSPTLHDGLGVVEEIRCYATERGPGIFRLEEHLQRFLQGVRVLGVSDFRWTMADLRRAVLATVQANSFQSCQVRLILTFDGRPGLDLDGYEPRLAVVAWEERARPAHPAGQPARLMFSSSLGAHANALLARITARRAGCDEAILLDADGRVTACTGGTLFAVRDGVVATPPRAGLPQGITRDTVLALAGDLGFPVVEAPLSRDELVVADELFYCGGSAEVVPARELDFRPVGDGQVGPVSAAIRSRYADTVRGQGARSAGWIEYVLMEPLY